MSLIDLFRKKSPAPVTGDSTPSAATTPKTAPSSPAAPAAAPAAAAPEQTALTQPEVNATQPPEEPNVRVFDDFGREVFIPASQWRAELLPQALQQASNNPDALSAILLDALQVGVAADLLPAAAHLQSIDPVAERGAAVHGLVLLASGDAAQAEDVFVTYLGQLGPSATILTHLARAQAAQGRMEEADQTLWRALEANPNDDGAVGLYAARSREREGDFGWQSALERAATLPGAWLPLMWLGRSALDGRNRSLGVALYKQALERAGQPVPVTLLQGISGDLGQFGLLDDALRLVRPAFNPEVHGLVVGNNLLKATLDSGNTGDALALVRDLARLNRPEFAEPLRAWEIEIRRRDLMAQAQQNPPQPQLLRIDGPVWLPPDSPSRTLYATAGARRGSVLFLGSSVSLPEELPQEAAGLPDTAGRLSRALPLFLAENAFALLTLDTQTLVPWAEVMGFAMLNQPWPDDAAAAYARDSGAKAAVTSHIQASPEGGTITLRLVPAAPVVAPSHPMQPMAMDANTAPSELEIGSPSEQPGSMSAEAAEEVVLADRPAVPGADAAVLGGDPLDEVPSFGESTTSAQTAFEPMTITASFTWPELHGAAQSLWPQLAIALVSQFGDTPEAPRQGRYSTPRGAELNVYLRLLEQLLGINCAMSSRHAPLLIQGERETTRGLIDLAVRYPASLPVRLMLGEVLLRVRALHPEALAEFAQPLQLLKERHPFNDAEAATLLQAQQDAAMTLQQQPQEQPQA